VVRVTGSAPGRPEDEAAGLQQLVDEQEWAGVEQVLGPLALAAAGGSDAALERLLYLVDRCRLAYAPIWSVVSDPNLVEDAAQETVVAVTRGIQTFRGDSRFTTWLYRVARHAAIATLRTARADAALSEAPEQLSGMTRSLSSIVTDRVALDRAIDALPSEFRDALTLRERDQLQYEEIASRLGVPIGTARSRISRARARLATSLREARALPA
jgi:RNA polymerase sigma-70 factor (ECF subfamily)